MKIYDLASYIVNRSIALGLPVSNLKLQKMLYFINLIYLGKYNKFLIEDLDDYPFEAWRYGPVIRSVYDRFSCYGGIPIGLEQPHCDVDNEVSEFLNYNIDRLVNIEPWRLVEWSHMPDGAWDKTCKNNDSVISKELIKKDAGL
ncbi:DUF4065 domain-containing protein [Campylobacter canadensis]|uniref:DUF4065 domain-containing protein n=2 Tax=Campylobacter canadensis TaxID=449520 RepID=A0ABS7WS92_9BACT|nr:DUF4065 domain-containing protein [Campylobacter canadensis]MBZ7998721.1 DUF4065 domain-containing protein [Campylobacter canadensis]